MKLNDAIMLVPTVVVGGISVFKGLPKGILKISILFSIESLSNSIASIELLKNNKIKKINLIAKIIRYCNTKCNELSKED